MKRFVLCILALLVITAALPFNVSAVSIGGISAKASVLIEAQTGTVIAGKNEYQKLPMASTTKIMSTLLLLESGDLDSEFKVDNEAIMVEGSSMGLCEDDIVTKRDLCYGMMLPSGNDAANQTAVLLAGSAEKFSEMMNKRAEQIGLRNTHFVTPSGLHDPEHYSTAYDMALLTREALKNDTFREICGTKSAKLKFGNPPYERWLNNTNKLLSMYDGCIGVKTGFTDEAGRCLVSAAERNGVTLICVTLNAPDDWNDHKELYDYGFSVTESVPIDYDFSEIKADIAGGSCDKILVVPSEMPRYTSVNGSKADIKAELLLKKFVYAPVEQGQNVGRVNFYSGDVLLCTVDLLAENGCEAVIIEKEPSISDKIVEWIKNLL